MAHLFVEGHYELPVRNPRPLRFVVFRRSRPRSTDQSIPSGWTVAGVHCNRSTSESPALTRIDAVERQMAANPKKVQAYNDLATAYVRRACETSDTRYYADASQAQSQGIRLDAGDFQLQRTQIAVMLGVHDYTQAKERATLLNRRTPDDVLTYGYLTEAEIASETIPSQNQANQICPWGHNTNLIRQLVLPWLMRLFASQAIRR